MSFKKFFLIFLLTSPVFAEPPPQVDISSAAIEKNFPDFERSLEVEGGAFVAGSDRYGAQFARIETRYFDPEVNAFVGMLVTASRFNKKLSLGSPPDVKTSFFVANWGAAVGIIRGSHLWAIDLMGVNVGERLAFGPALVGEHRLGKSPFKLFHRTAFDLFTGDTIVDSDQGVQVGPWKNVSLSLGYRIFTARHISRNGPRASLIFRFNTPKMWVIFPSLG